MSKSDFDKIPKKNVTAADLMYALGRVDDEILLACEDYGTSASGKVAGKAAKIPLYKNRTLIRSLSAAACFALIITGFYYMGSLNKKSDNMENYNNSSAPKSEDMNNSGNAAPEMEKFDDANKSPDNTDGNPSDGLFPESAVDNTETITESSVSIESSELSKLPLATQIYFDGSFEGLLFSNDEEFLENFAMSSVSAETFAEFDSMPVYSNPVASYPISHGLSGDEVSGIYNYLADSFGVNCPSETSTAGKYNFGYGEDYVTGMRTVDSGDVSIRVSADGLYSVKFTSPSQLNAADYSTVDEAVLAYLGQFDKIFSELSGISISKCVVEKSRARSYDGAFGKYSYVVYEPGEDAAETLYKKCVYIHPYMQDDGTFVGFYVNSSLMKTSELGTYPIITLDEAERLLKSGQYLTTVPDEFGSGQNPVIAAEMVYRTMADEGVLMPYFKFWLALTSGGDDNNLTNYGAFYVPAIAEDYFEKTENSSWQ